MKNINSLNPIEKDIDMQILTHTHFEYCQNAFMIKDQKNCKILMSLNEAEYPIRGYTPLPIGTFKGFYSFKNQLIAPSFDKPQRMKQIFLEHILPGKNSIADIK
jgi:glyoxylase-like metal-dependent hydrolase (beta-lactamase superfamily II)